VNFFLKIDFGRAIGTDDLIRAHAGVGGHEFF